MKSSAWSKALKTCADPHRAKHFLALLEATDAGSALEKAAPEQARIVAALLGGSQALSTLRPRHRNETSRSAADCKR
jgi:hypothetical protein